MLLLLLFSRYLLTNAIAELCFIRVSSSARRDSLGVIPALSQIGCNVRCLDTPGCDACMFYSDRGKCNLLGPARSPPPGQCPLPYVCYAKSTSGCPVYSAPSASRSYSPGPCSRSSDVGTPPVPGSPYACGSPPIGTPRDTQRTVLDAILHDGTRMVMENSHLSSVQWDSYMGSWFYESLNGIKAYFKAAACVHPPYPALSPSCDCLPLPLDNPIIPGYTATSETPRIRTQPICTTPLAQVHFKRAWNDVYGDVAPSPLGSRDFYCAMGEWMFFSPVPDYEEYMLVAASCLN